MKCANYLAIEKGTSTHHTRCGRTAAEEMVAGENFNGGSFDVEALEAREKK